MGDPVTQGNLTKAKEDETAKWVAETGVVDVPVEDAAVDDAAVEGDTQSVSSRPATLNIRLVDKTGATSSWMALDPDRKMEIASI
jgi:hypothetical protein